MGKQSKIARLHELFDVGEIITIAKGDEVLTFWVSKPSTFDKQETLNHARGGRARAMLAFDADEDQQDELRLMCASLEDRELINDLVVEEGWKNARLATDDLHTDAKWAERLEAVESNDGSGTEEELAATEVAAKEIEVEFLRRKALLDVETLRDFQEKPRAKLESEFAALYRNMAGNSGYHEASRHSQIYFALRNCEATLVEGEWTHERCGGHRERAVVSRPDVRTLPEAILLEASAVLDKQMSEAQAGNSDAPSVSSGSLEQPSKAEDSTPSTPDAM